MNLGRIIATIVFFFIATSLQAQQERPLARDLYLVDKKVEIEEKKFEFIDTGVLKSAMKIRVFWNDNIFFNNYDEGSVLDCFTLSTINGDTISIIGYMVGMVGYGFTLKLFGDSCIVASYAISDGDIYQTGPKEKSYTNHVILPSTVHRVRLLKKPLFKEGETVAGHVQLKSVPFYYKGLEGKFVIELNAYF